MLDDIAVLVATVVMVLLAFIVVGFKVLYCLAERFTAHYSHICHISFHRLEDSKAKKSNYSYS